MYLQMPILECFFSTMSTKTQCFNVIFWKFFIVNFRKKCIHTFTVNYKFVHCVDT